MKKLFAMLLALVMCLALCVPAFAEETTTPTDQETVTIKKLYKLEGAGTSPEETFTLEVVSSSVTNGEAASAPDLSTIIGATFAKGAATAAGANGTISIALPTYTQVGVYEYILKETAGTTAGVTYRPETETIKLVVTVINDGDGKLRIATVHTETAEGADKSDTFENKYSAGTLEVSKTVTGNMGDKDKKFKFTVVFEKPAGEVKSEITADVNGTALSDFNVEWGTDGKYTYEFELSHDQTAKFVNLPYGVKYTVTEDSYTDDGYTTTRVGDDGIINAGNQTVAFTNHKQVGVDMGVNLDSLPYVLALVIVAGGAAVMFARKRRVED